MKNKFIFIILILILTNSNISFAKNANYPYQLDAKTESIIISSGVSLWLGSFYFKSKNSSITNQEISRLDPKNINSFDRSATNNWSTKSQRGSDVALAALLVSPALLGLDDNVKNNIGTTLTIYLEGILLNSGLTDLTKNYFERKRPYLYNDSVSVNEKTKHRADSKKSFISGHTSFAFYSATFLSKTFTDLNPGSEYSKFIYLSTYSIASLTGYLRYRGGMHFPTDIIAGAIVGTAIGYIIPELHRIDNSNIDVAIYYTCRTNIAVTYKF